MCGERLHCGERVLDSVPHLAGQKLLLLLRAFAFGNVSRNF
jgi:hypothetical protein